MRVTNVALIAAGLAAASPLPAQRPAYDAAIAARPPVQGASRTPRLEQPAFRKGERFALRLVTGTIGMAAGVYAGAGMGASNTSCGGCDDQLAGAIVGASILGVIGTGIGVGVFALGDGCSTAGRIGMGMGGAALGGVLGLLLAPMTNGYSIAGGAVIVGSAMAGSCAPHR